MVAVIKVWVCMMAFFSQRNNMTPMMIIIKYSNGVTPDGKQKSISMRSSREDYVSAILLNVVMVIAQQREREGYIPG